MQIEISVSIITYNHEEFIAKALDSVLAQNLDIPFEIVVGDDGSSDSTVDIVKSYQKKYTDIIKLCERNRNDFRGYIHSGRKNFLENILSCNGKYIALLDGDDFWDDPEKLTTQYELLEKNERFSGVMHGTVVLRTEDNKKLPWRDKYESLYLTKDLIRLSTPFHTSSFFFRKKFLVIPKWLKTVSSGDIPLFFLISLNGPIVNAYKLNPSVYRKHLGGITQTSLHLKNIFHLTRIALWQQLNEHSGYKFDKFVGNVIIRHLLGLEVKRLKERWLLVSMAFRNMRYLSVMVVLKLLKRAIL